MNLFNYQNGLEGLIINPMISIMFSLVLIFGVIKIGKIILLKLDSFVVNPTKKVYLISNTLTSDIFNNKINVVTWNSSFFENLPFNKNKFDNYKLDD